MWGSQVPYTHFLNKGVTASRGLFVLPFIAVKVSPLVFVSVSLHYFAYLVACYVHCDSTMLLSF